MGVFYESLGILVHLRALNEQILKFSLRRSVEAFVKFHRRDLAHAAVNLQLFN